MTDTTIDGLTFTGPCECGHDHRINSRGFIVNRCWRGCSCTLFRRADGASSIPARDSETLSDEQFERLLDEYEMAAVAWGNAREREIQRECDDDCAAKRAAIVAAVAALRARTKDLETALDQINAEYGRT